MKIILIIFSVFFLLGCSTQADQKSDIVAKDKSRISQSSQTNKTEPENNNKEDSSNSSVTAESKKERDICASREEASITDEIISLLNAKFPDYRMATNNDFPDNYWCHFYSESQSPYHITGDFDGDEETETVLMINKDERYTTLTILIDKVNGKLQSTIITESKLRTDINIEPRFTKYFYGLNSKAPFQFKPIDSDTT